MTSFDIISTHTHLHEYKMFSLTTSTVASAKITSKVRECVIIFVSFGSRGYPRRRFRTPIARFKYNPNRLVFKPRRQKRWFCARMMRRVFWCELWYATSRTEMRRRIRAHKYFSRARFARLMGDFVVETSRFAEEKRRFWICHRYTVTKGPLSRYLCFDQRNSLFLLWWCWQNVFSLFRLYTTTLNRWTSRLPKESPPRLAPGSPSTPLRYVFLPPSLVLDRVHKRLQSDSILTFINAFSLLSSSFYSINSLATLSTRLEVSSPSSSAPTSTPSPRIPSLSTWAPILWTPSKSWWRWKSNSKSRSTKKGPRRLAPSKKPPTWSKRKSTRKFNSSF